MTYVHVSNIDHKMKVKFVVSNSLLQMHYILFMQMLHKIMTFTHCLDIKHNISYTEIFLPNTIEPLHDIIHNAYMEHMCIVCIFIVSYNFILFMDNS